MCLIDQVKPDLPHCGYRWDASSNLFAVRNRFYHSQLCIWLTRDPIIVLPNLYAYCRSRSLLYTDPTGLDPVPPYSMCSRFGVPPRLLPGEMKKDYTRAEMVMALGPGKLNKNSKECLDFGCIGLTSLHQGQGDDPVTFSGGITKPFKNPMTFGDTKCYDSLEKALSRKCDKDLIPFVFHVRGFGKGSDFTQTKPGEPPFVKGGKVAGAEDGEVDIADSIKIGPDPDSVEERLKDRKWLGEIWDRKLAHARIVIQEWTKHSENLTLLDEFVDVWLTFEKSGQQPRVP